MPDEPPNWRMGETYSDLLEEMSRERAMALAEVERLQEDVACHDRLLEIMREHAAALGIKYNGDQEYLVSVKAKVKRLEAKLEQQRQNSIIRPLYDDMRRAEGMEAAAKVAPQEPAGMRSGDEGFWTGWLRGVREFRAAILTVAKDTITHRDGGDAKETT